MKTAFTIIPDPKQKKQPVIIRQDDVGPETPSVVVPDGQDEEKDTGPRKPRPGERPS